MSIQIRQFGLRATTMLRIANVRFRSQERPFCHFAFTLASECIVYHSFSFTDACMPGAARPQ